MNPVQTTKMSNWRWVICALLFLATTVNYMDRQVLSLTWKDFIAPEFHWNDNDYGTITGWFSIFYAIANLFAGKFIDWMGTRRRYQQYVTNPMYFVQLRIACHPRAAFLY